MAKTLFDRIWESHVVREAPDEPALLYIDLHLIHEVTSAQAFEGLRLAGRQVRRPDLSLATMDHNVPTTPGPIEDPLAKAQLDALRSSGGRSSGVASVQPVRYGAPFAAPRTASAEKASRPQGQRPWGLFLWSGQEARR